MIRRRVAGLAIAAAALGGAGLYSTATAFAATPTPAPTPSETSQDSRPPADRDAMIRHCTEQLPADQRDTARQHMEGMMSGHDSMMGGMNQMGGMDHATPRPSPTR